MMRSVAENTIEGQKVLQYLYPFVHKNIRQLQSLAYYKLLQAVVFQTVERENNQKDN